MAFIVELLKSFSLVGAVSFGGHMSMVAQVRTMVVERRRWMKGEEFSELVALASLLPGPVAVNVVASCGYRVRGWIGAGTAVLAVLWPSVLMMCFLTVGYASISQMDFVFRAMEFVDAIIAALVVSAGIRMISPVNAWWPGLGFGWWRFMVLIGALFITLIFPGYSTMFVLMLVSALLGIMAFRRGWISGSAQPLSGFDTFDRVPTPPLVGLVSLVVVGLAIWYFQFGALWLEVFTDFAKISLSLFGGGYGIVPLLKSVLVDAGQGLKEADLVAGVSMGQLTPGPILVSSVFYGYQLAGWTGALAATAGMFIPAGILMVVVVTYATRLRDSWIWRSAFHLLKVCVAGFVLYSGIFIVLNQLEMWEGIHYVFLIGTFVLLHFTRAHVVWLLGLAFLLAFLPL